MRSGVRSDQRPGPVRSAGRRDAIAETLVILSWLVVVIGGFVVTVIALVVQVRGSDQPAGAIGACGRPESVVIVLDDSSSVVELDPTDRRSGAVGDVIDRLAAEPCTVLDVVTVISFTGTVVTTGPAPAAEIGPIGRAGGHGTDLAAAVEAGRRVIASRPDHRPIVVVLSDLEDRSGPPVDDTLGRLAADGVDVVVVPIGDAEPGPGVVAVELRSRETVADDLIDIIGEARQRE